MAPLPLIICFGFEEGERSSVCDTQRNKFVSPLKTQDRPSNAAVDLLRTEAGCCHGYQCVHHRKVLQHVLCISHSGREQPLSLSKIWFSCFPKRFKGRLMTMKDSHGGDVSKVQTLHGNLCFLLPAIPIVWALEGVS